MQYSWLTPKEFENSDEKKIMEALQIIRDAFRHDRWGHYSDKYRWGYYSDSKIEVYEHKVYVKTGWFNRELVFEGYWKPGDGPKGAAPHWEFSVFKRGLWEEYVFSIAKEKTEKALAWRSKQQAQRDKLENEEETKKQAEREQEQRKADKINDIFKR